MKPRILVIGSLNMDMVVQTKRFPEAGETVLGNHFYQAFGGKGANQAVAAARLGGDVEMIGCGGEDDIGTRMIQNLAAEKIIHDRLLKSGEKASGVALIEVDAAGENRIICVPGANNEIKADWVEDAVRNCFPFDCLILQFEVPLDVVLSAASAAQKLGAKVILNPAPAIHFEQELYSMIDVIIPNENEAEVLSGISIHSEQDVKRAAEVIHEKSSGLVIITLGKDGAYFLSRDGSGMIPSCEVKAVDSTAAGDAFIAGFSIGWMEGRDIKDAIRFANACGCLAVQKHGAQPSLPDRQVVNTFLRTA